MQIKCRFSSKINFEFETDSKKICLEKGVEAKADLRSSNLRYSDLRSSDLSSSNLRYSNLRYSDLRSSNLRYSDLSSSDLRYSDLSSSDLRGAKLPPATEILLASWGNVSDHLCVELMRWDAWNHSDRSKFDEWVKTGSCPYDDEKFQRAANFSESKDLWKEHGYAQPKSAYELVMMLFKEKEIKFGEEEDSE